MPALKFRPNKTGIIPGALREEMDMLRSPKGYLYAGLPKFEELFGRDSLIAAWQLLDYDPNIAKSTLRELSKFQGQHSNPETGEEPGKIPHELRELDEKGAGEEKYFESLKSGVNWWRPGTPYYFSVDSTPLFLITFAEYYNRTHDGKLLEELRPNLVSAIRWMLDYGIRDGMLRYSMPNDGKGLKSQSWKDGIGNLLEKIASPVAVVEVQGYTYKALKAMVPIIRRMGMDAQLVQRMEDDAVALKRKFNEEFWSSQDNFYYLAKDGKGAGIMRITSNPGHLLFTGIVDKEYADAIVSRLFSPEMITAYGIRTHATSEPDFDEHAYQLGSVWPHDNWIIAQGLKSMGYGREYAMLRNAMLNMYEDLGHCPEYVPISKGGLLLDLNDLRLASKPCIPQAWTVGAVINLMMEGKKGA
ncbi:MAG: hypothetical protein M1569_00925 [Candidatus Marsarchaeota archaeon]|nr:hypothetical protein [Candidatus Marsarchaeota archaeon]MCL5412950.1 hypothetical protein [Candidatus Marsarchaeota archaeon]